MTRRSLFPGTPPAPPPAPPVPRPTPAPTSEPRIETSPAGRKGSEASPFSVRELSARIRESFEDAFPRSFWLEGELSSVSRPKSGHLYLSFTEKKALIEAVAWASDARNFARVPARGDRVRAYGRLRTYEGKSRYQFQIQRLEQAGLGALLQELHERERRLEGEGLFESGRKRPIPFLPLRIGLVTAEGSDAWHDFTRAARDRFPGVRIRERFAPVQGPAAPAAITAAIEQLGREPLDVIVVARGGGSVEDLLPFSDELVVRAAAACPTPLVSAIGHDQDRPLLDRVADGRAATPSAAARDILPVREELRQEVTGRQDAARAAVRQFLKASGDRLHASRSHRAAAAFPQWIERERQGRRQDRTGAREAASRRISAAEDRLRNLRTRREAGDPVRRLGAQQRQFRELRERLFAPSLLRLHSERLAALGARVSFAPLTRRLADDRTAVGEARTRSHRAARRRLDDRGRRVAERGGELRALDPKEALRRGYSLALDAGGQALVSSRGVHPGDRFRLVLHEGELDAAVERVRAPADKPEATPAGPEAGSMREKR